MPNTIKYSTTGDTFSLKKGNFFIGVGDVGKGPSTSTQTYNGVSPVASGYTIYIYNPAQASNVSFYSANNDLELITFTNNISGQSFTGITECFNWYATQTNYVCVNRDYGTLVTNGLISAYDFGFTPSYPRSGNTLYDISYSGANMTLYNSPQYSSQYGGGIMLDNVNDYIRTFGLNLNNLAASNNFTVGFWCLKEFYGTGGNNFGNSTLINGATNGYNTGWRIVEGNTGTPGNPFSGRHYFSIGMPDLGNGIGVLDGAAIYRPVYIVLSVTPTVRFAYCNGGFTSGATGTYVSGSTYGYIGNADAGAGRWGGKIWNIQFYNRGLSLAEVKQNYLAYINRFTGVDIVTGGLVLNVDAGYSGSYPTTGTLWADISGNNLNGTLVNGPTYSSSNGGVIDFDGTNDLVNCQNILNFIYTDAFTTESWINWDGGVQPNNAGHIIGKTFGNYRTFLITDISPGYVSFRLDSNGQTTNTSGVIAPNGWYHIVSSWNPTTFTAKVYVNGVELASTTNTSTDWTYQGANFQIGNSPNENYYFNGKISLGRVYNKTLSQADILQNYRAQFARFLGENIVMDGLLFYIDAGYRSSYRTTGTLWYDVSGNNRNVTLSNGPIYTGTSGGSIIFDGVDDKATISSTIAEPTGIRLGSSVTPWMVNIWIKTTASGSNSINTFPILTNQSGGPVVSNIGIGAGGVLKYAHYNGSWIVDVGTIPINNGNWHMVTWVNLDNNTMNLYVDGVFDRNISSTIVGGGNINPVDSIGYGWAGYLSATIATVAIYKRNYSYSSAEVLQNFNAQKSRFGL
jgi:hypothetical protein